MLIATMLASVSAGVLLGVAAVPVPPRDRVTRANEMVRAWNDLAKSLNYETELLLELQENLKSNPPPLVFDARRGELYRLAIVEQVRQIKNLEQLKANDR